MNDPKCQFSPLRNLLENAARNGDTACIGPDNVQIAENIVRENGLNVAIYILPKPAPKPQPL